VLAPDPVTVILRHRIEGALESRAWRARDTPSDLFDDAARWRKRGRPTARGSEDPKLQCARSSPVLALEVPHEVGNFRIRKCSVVLDLLDLRAVREHFVEMAAPACRVVALRYSRALAQSRTLSILLAVSVSPAILAVDPCGAKNLKTLLNETLNETIIVTENGGRRSLPSAKRSSPSSPIAQPRRIFALSNPPRLIAEHRGAE
jgi:hypothetical protein